VPKFSSRTGSFGSGPSSWFGHSKSEQTIKCLDTYLTHRKIMVADRIIIIEKYLKGNAAKFFNMVKDTTSIEETFKQLFLKHLFSEDRQWDIFIKCTEAGKKSIKNNFQNTFISGWQN
jgi:hypothetical protein